MKTRLAVVTAMALFVGTLAAPQTAFAKENGKPGHTGWSTKQVMEPPGQTTTPCKPGHGYGDKEHCHYGPPGQNKGNRWLQYRFERQKQQLALLRLWMRTWLELFRFG